MIRRAVRLVLLAILISSFPFAQASAPASHAAEQADVTVVVHVIYPNEKHAGEHITVMLESPGGGVITQTFTNSEGQATFVNLTPGLYVIRLRDQTIKETATGILQIYYERIHHEYIRVQPADSSGGTEMAGSAVSGSQSRIPAKARKEFDQGNSAFAAGDTGKAIQHFQKATELYPQYAMAYNKLAGIYTKAEDFARAREALNKALKADPDLVLTQANLIGLSIEERNFPDAIVMANKALQKQPNNAQFLFLMCKAQFLSANYDDALIYARKVYANSHKDFELAHIVAGRSLELRGHPDEARAEYTKLLQESPSVPEATEARKSLARLEGAAKAK